MLKMEREAMSKNHLLALAQPVEQGASTRVKEGKKEEDVLERKKSKAGLVTHRQGVLGSAGLERTQAAKATWKGRERNQEITGRAMIEQESFLRAAKR